MSSLPLRLSGTASKKAEPARSRRLLDDHLHDVPEAVYDLLTAVGERAKRPLTVILERDGRYPKIESLLNELERARAALRQGESGAPNRIASEA